MGLIAFDSLLSQVYNLIKMSPLTYQPPAVEHRSSDITEDETYEFNSLKLYAKLVG